LKRATLVLLALTFLGASCADTATPPPVVVPEGEDRYLIDVHTGAPAVDPATDRKLDAAWRFALAGNEAEARKRLAEVTRTSPNYLPALLTEAAIDIRAGRFDTAQALVARVLERDPDNIVAQVYEAESAFRQQQTRRAYDLYRAVAARADAPATARERLTALESTLFQELFAAAQGTTNHAEAARLLREALTFNPAAVEPRILLAQRLVAQRQFDEARRELDPLLNTGEVDRSEIQEMLAEIDVGRGRYQEAIVRYDRLARRMKEPRYASRLEEIKEEWSMANMPPQYRQALESPALTRAELAVLLYWTVPSIRFAQNLGSPPIAIDIENTTGREEIIRAIAIGLFEIDPVTRRVSPFRTITAERLSRHLARVLQLRGATCARNVAIEKVLSACNVADPLASLPPDATVTGRDAARPLAEVARALQ
jgi:tetratricopeptide (TPR) repeat protein